MAHEDGPLVPWGFEGIDRYCYNVTIFQMTKMWVGVVLGKYIKTYFPSSDNEVTSILNLVHSKVCGPMSFISLRGCEYHVTFIDSLGRPILYS